MYHSFTLANTVGKMYPFADAAIAKEGAISILSGTSKVWFVQSIGL